MKPKGTKILIVSVIMLTTTIIGCKDVIYENDLRNVPVYLSYNDLRTSSIVKTESSDLINPGKIYFYNGFIFINEELKGVHIIDNTDPENPENKAFIKIPGNMDIAIKDGILYADSYIDLVAIDISDIENPKEVKRVENVFPYTIPKINDTNYLMAEIDEDKGVVIGWEIDYAKIKVERKSYPIYHSGWYGENYNRSTTLDAMSGYSNSSATQSTSGYTSTSTQNSSFGIGGSMARFGLNKDYLYTVDREDFHIYSVSTSDILVLKNEKEAGFDIETMFIHDDHMFLGTMNGMLVFSLDDPYNPTKIHSYSHVKSCDPVVVQNHIAYITLRAGNECGRTVSRLDILLLNADYTDSNLLYSYDMREPYGLGIDDEILFVCDGKDGLMVFEASDLATISQKKIAQFADIDAFDVIPFNDYLFMIGDDGFYQYDYSDLQNIHQISFIPVKQGE